MKDTSSRTQKQRCAIHAHTHSVSLSLSLSLSHTHTHTHTHYSPCVLLQIFFQLFYFKITRAVKELKSNHRLILTGTPIQVSVYGREQMQLQDLVIESLGISLCSIYMFFCSPSQNNVVDLWSLFDFLMPGYLGNQRQFQERFSKPILSSRDAKSSSKEQEAGE